DLSEQPVDPKRVYVLTNDIGATEYFFDADGKLTRMEDLNENYLDFSYDHDRLVRIVDQANRSTTLEYTRNRLSKIIDMAGRTSTYAYDQRGNLITIKHAVGTADEVTTQLRYNRGNLLGKITNPRGLSSYIAYGRRGEVRTITDATPEHNPILGFRYIKRNQETVVARPDDEGKFQTARYTFNDAGQITEITDPFGATTRVAYDNLLRQSSVTPAGSSAGYQYTYFGETSLVERARNEAGEQTRRGSDLLTGGQRYIIDSRNEARQEAGKSFVATVYYRDDRGNITTIEVNRYAPETDLDQEPLPEPQENLRSIGYTYSSGGLVTSMIDPKGNQTHFTYQDGTGYLTTVTTPAGAGEMSDRVTLVKPNVEGSPTQMIDPKGQKRTFKYDGLGRTKHIAFKGEDGLKAFSHTYAFDPNGNISAIQDSSGSTKWNYDEDDQIIRESRAQNNITQTTHYDYFTKGLLESITTFDNELIHFRYDNKLRVESQTDPKDGGRAITYEYDERGRRTAITFPSGTAQKILYDNANRIDLMTLEQQDGTKLQSFDYDYSVRNNEDFRGGNVLRITELDGSTINYGYDDLDRLIAATRTGTLPFNQKYTYDDNNNRTSMTLDGEVLTAEYDAANQMVEFADTNYRYDRNGNLLSYGENNLNYDQANRWVNGIINGIDVSFEYDGLGRRSSKTVDTERTDYWYNITGLTQETGATEATYLRDLSGALRSVSSDGAVYNYGKDRIGSVRALVDSDGALATDYTYDPWGNLLGDVSDMPNSYRYTSTYSDEATNLYQMGARYYQATSGRFTQADP
ncbi:MAG: RHS repeat-associated core domain-containing protein, partial [Chloroflexota bacterium]